MNDREALVTLVNAADFLSEKDKRRFTEAVVQMPDDDVRSMGVFLRAYLTSETQDLVAHQAAVEKLSTLMQKI